MGREGSEPYLDLALNLGVTPVVGVQTRVYQVATCKASTFSPVLSLQL